MSQVDELFPPRPGGMVDQARQRAQAEQTQADAAAVQEPVAAKIEVPVSERGTEFARARTYAVAVSGQNPSVQIGRDDNRRYAVIMTLDEPIVIAFSRSAADDPVNAVNAAGLPANGFVLPVGVPVPVNFKGEIFIVATSSTLTRVSYMAFAYEDTEAAR